MAVDAHSKWPEVSKMRSTTAEKTIEKPESRKPRTKERIFHPGDQVLACNYTNGPKWVPTTVIAQTGPVSYTVRTCEDIVWRRHVDQLLAGATAPEGTPPVSCAEPGQQVSPTQPTRTQDAADGGEPAPSGVPPADPQTELFPSPTPTSVPDTASGGTPDGSATRRYPQRERRSPERLNL